MSVSQQKASPLYNKELSPESASGTWKTINLFNWWMSAWHSLGGYTVAIGLFALGLMGWQVILAFSIGIVILYFVNNLSGVAGQRVKVPFPVFARASFGVYGANIPALLRAVVAIAGYGIQTYLASAVVMLLAIVADVTRRTLAGESVAGCGGVGGGGPYGQLRGRWQAERVALSVSVAQIRYWRRLVRVGGTKRRH